MPIRSRMSSIMGQIEPQHPELFALEFGKITEYDCLHWASTKSAQIIALGSNLALPCGSQLLNGLIPGKLLKSLCT